MHHVLLAIYMYYWPHILLQSCSAEVFILQDKYTQHVYYHYNCTVHLMHTCTDHKVSSGQQLFKVIHANVDCYG